MTIVFLLQNRCSLGYVIKILTAPIIIRKISHLNPNRTMKDVGVFLGTRRIVSSGHRKAAKNPVSSI